MVTKLPSSSLVSTSSTSSRRPAASSSNTGVCRTLFHHREIGARFPSRSASSTRVTLQKSLRDSSEDDGSEVIVKDCNGNFDVQTPSLSPHEDDQLQDEFTERESMQQVVWSLKLELMLYIEIETRLLEMYKNRSLQPGEPPAG